MEPITARSITIRKTELRELLREREILTSSGYLRRRYGIDYTESQIDDRLDCIRVRLLELNAELSNIVTAERGCVYRG